MLKSRFLPVMIVALTLSAQAAYANDDAKAEKPKDKKICKVERATGSLTRSTRICLTKDEWDKVNDDANDTLNTMVNNGRRPGSGGDMPSQGLAGAGLGGR